MVKKLWNLLSPFHKTFFIFLLLALCYETAQLGASYVISLVIGLFEAGITFQSWIWLILGLLVFDEIFMRIDNAYDWHIVSRHSHPIYRFLKLSAISKFLKMDIPWHQKHNSGALVGKVGDGVWKTLNIVDAMSWEFVPTVVQAVISLIPLLIFSPWVALVAVVTFVLFIYITSISIKAKQPYRVRRHDFYEEEWRKSVESVQSVETNLMFGQQDRLISDQEKLHDGIIDEAMQEHRLGIFKYTRWRIRLLTFTRRLILVIWILQLFSGTLSIANLFFANVLIERLYHSFWRFARLWDQTTENSEGALRLANLLSEKEPEETGRYVSSANSRVGISLNNVCFAYEGDYSETDGALHDFTLDIKPGSIVALVGPSGAGKTTIRKVITRLVKIQKGSIKVGGVDITDWDGASLLRQFSYVPQGDDVYIFDDTVFNNIAFPTVDASEASVREAAILAGIHDFITTLKDGYQTQVGERGVRLSGGQKQRIALARAILADRPVLVLDEATSAVDAITEKEIQTNMKKILSGKTAIIIAHRLSTVWNLADKIVVMDKGRKVEEGTHLELVATKGIYSQMVSLQTE